ncbi:protein serine/threonine phosphatase [Methanolacinia petrolearia DSM 11571]|uniref:Protein serine/threonine phosphatase n=1 Tax=Methanolacinia petrolearia (strain DSM 11571 / OCM 486 / SEBR 4847) TaxID=679926 RepID=E1RFS6_METP4|nr:protein phosphatase 2C domain-containing protein [Methanolacinia petrolearia]ADN37380.1 protein serine/threonine phosphatase [Methanolacinia petrolearia DSM 11571]
MYGDILEVSDSGLMEKTGGCQGPAGAAGVKRLYDISGVSVQGRRPKNEDTFYIRDFGDACIFAVADGMGGLPHGDVASGIAIDTVKNFSEEGLSLFQHEKEMKAFLVKIHETAHKRIIDEARGDLFGMGTTLTTAVLNRNRLYIANSGDSRAYVVGDGIRFRTTDHTQIQKLVDAGSISENEARFHPLRNSLYGYVGGNFVVDTYSLELSEYDIVILCTDGFYAYTTGIEFFSLRDYTHSNHIAQSLVNSVIAKSDDNVTVIAARFR